MYKDQGMMEASPLFGVLEVYAVYNRLKGTLEVNILRAENLISLDINGLSDPFVTVR